MDVPVNFTFLTALKDGFHDFAKTYPTVLKQSDPAFEWIIVDDASKEPLRDAFPDLAGDSRVKIFRHEKGQGQTVSLNEGIQASHGDWIVRMDGDDLCAPERLAEIKAAVKGAPMAVLLFSDYKIIDGTDKEWAEVRMRSPLPAPFFDYLNYHNNPICHPTVAFRRKKSDGSFRLFREDLVNAQDYALWKEIFRESGASAFLHLPKPLISYRIVRDSLSGARAKEQEVEKMAIRGNKMLARGDQTRPLLSERQKDAMQSYRLLYYRFVGKATAGSAAEDLALLKTTRALGVHFLKATFFLTLRPLRKLLLRRMFGGIYE